MHFPEDKFKPRSETRCGAAQDRGWMDYTGLPFPTSRPSSLILLSAFLSIFHSPSIFQSFPPPQPLHLSQLVSKKPEGSAQERRGQDSSDCATILHACYQNGFLPLIHRLHSTALMLGLCGNDLGRIRGVINGLSMLAVVSILPWLF